MTRITENLVRESSKLARFRVEFGDGTTAERGPGVPGPCGSVASADSGGVAEVEVQQPAESAALGHITRPSRIHALVGKQQTVVDADSLLVALGVIMGEVLPDDVSQAALRVLRGMGRFEDNGILDECITSHRDD